MNRIVFFFLLAFLTSCDSKKSTDTQKPNFVFILADDLGWKDLGCWGSTFHETPNLNRLASEGIRFTNAYATCPVCSPTRASIMTGKYPARIDLTDWIAGRQQWANQTGEHKLLSKPFKHQMELEETTLAEALKETGYTTFFAGKWHLGEDSIYWPTHQGFDINKGGWKRGAPNGRRGYFSPYKNPRLEDGPEGEYLTDRLADESIAFLEEYHNNPFLLYLSFYTVHNPLNGKPEKIEKYEKKRDSLNYTDEERFNMDKSWMKTFGRGNFKERLVQDNPVYASMVESMDENIGRVLNRIKELGIEKNTIIFFMSDNGGLATSEGSNTTNLPLRAGKGWLYEGGIREPMIIKWPGSNINGYTIDIPVTSTDFYPTILEIAGLKLKPAQHIDGKSLVPLLKKNNDTTDISKEFLNRPIFWHYPHYSNQGGKPGSAVRLGNYKLIEFFEDNRIELYDLENDPGERQNISEEYPGVVKKLKNLLDSWRDSVNAKFPDPNPLYPEKE